MKLEKEVAAVNAALEPELAAAGLSYRLDGLAVPFVLQAGAEVAQGFINRYLAPDNDSAAAAPDDAFDVHVFHLARGAEFTPSEYLRGRAKTQEARNLIVLIGYTTRRQFIDYVQHELAKLSFVELRLLELAPDVINQKYLGLDKQLNADFRPRQLFALTYALTSAPRLGGDACPRFDFSK